MSEEKRDDLLGKTLGQYEILEEIGRGGMATVYRARQMSINRIVAVKVLPRHFLHDPGFFERFEREVDVIAHLEHPHILPIYDYGKAENVPYIAMRFLGGGSMAQLIRRGPIPFSSLDQPFAQVAQALDYAHRQGIIHRDLKPGNVMLDENGNAYLSDFGIARVLGSNLTGSMIIGTPAYMSPEQANGMPLDARSDIYSLGVVLFELLTGREPFQAETPMALLLKHINEPVPPVATLRPDVPPAVESVIARATAKDPSARYTSAGEMAQDFSHALRSAGVGRSATPRPMPVEDTPTLLPDAGSPYTPRGMTPPPTPGQPVTPYGMTPPPTPGQPVTPYGMTPPPITGAGQYPTPYPAARRSNLPLILGVVAVVVVLALAAVVVLPRLSPQEAPVTLMQATLPAPTPFQNAQRIEVNEYSVMIPREWIPPQGFYDLSDSERLVHLWQPQDLSSFVAVHIPTNINITDPVDFETGVQDYANRWYGDDRAANLSLIDTATAPDGTVRKSYRIFGETSPQLEPGQLDVFYLNRAPYLVVFETYSSDALGNRFVPTFQRILDSLNVKLDT